MSYQPTISVIINTCDRQEPLRTVLYALNRQTYQNFEVIVVLGPTKDDSAQMLATEFINQIYVVNCPVFNLAVSRNLGVTAAQGEIVAFIDDDAVPCSTWLEQIAVAYNDPTVSGVGGRVYQIHPGMGDLQFLAGMFSALAEQRDVRLNQEYPVASSTPAQFWFPRFMGANMTYRRDVLFTIGGFDEHFEYLFDDADIGVRLGLKHYHLKQLLEGVVYHVPASGRNRQMFTWNINWYTWLKCTIYFALKNGIPAVGLFNSLSKAIKHTINFYTQVQTLYEQKAFPHNSYIQIKRQLLKGWLWGFWHGLFMPRAIPSKLEPEQRSFTLFCKSDSRNYPAISPFGTVVRGKIQSMEREVLRICLLSMEYPPHSTHGVARSTHMLAKGLAELGHEVHIITRGDSDKVTYYGGAFVHQLRADYKTRYRSFLDAGYSTTYWWLNYSHEVFEKVKSLQLNHRIQLVDSPLWQLEGLVTAVSKISPTAVRVVTALKQISDVHEQLNPDTRLIGDLETEFLQLSDGIISNTQATVQTIKRVYGLDPTSKLHRIILYGIEPTPESEIFSLQDNKEPVILFVGRLEHRKGILDLFTAIPIVLKEFPTAQFWIAGSDNSQHDGFQATHKQDYPTYFAKNYLNCRNNVKFFGFVDDAKLPELYKACDLFVAPSLYESFGLIYVEAMNYLRPTIGCNAGGPTDIIAHGETGLLVPPESPMELAEAIICLLGDFHRRREMGIAGRQRFLQLFTHRKMAEGFVDFYHELLK